MIADAYTVEARKVQNAQGEWVTVGQFGLLSVVQFDAAGNFIGDMSANSTFVRLSIVELNEIARMQTPDTFSLDQKMNWLLWAGEGTWGAPMSATWNSKAGETWRNAVNIRMIGAVYAGQPVTLTGESKMFRMTWQNKTEDVLIHRIQTGTKQKVTVVDRADRYGEEPKGVIWLPLWFRTNSVWIPDRWLV